MRRMRSMLAPLLLALTPLVAPAQAPPDEERPARAPRLEARLEPAWAVVVPARVASVVVLQSVTPGQAVRKGEVLVRLDDRRQRIAVDRAQAALMVVKAELKASQQLRELAREEEESWRAALSADVRKAEAGLAAAETELRREGLREDVASARHRLVAAERKLRRKQIAYELERARVEGRARDLEARRALAELELSWCAVRAPRDGVVASVSRVVGEAVDAREPLLTLHGQSRLRVRVAMAAGLVAGYRARPVLVRTVDGRLTLPARFVGAAPRGDGMLLVTFEVEAGERGLPGMTVRVVRVVRAAERPRDE